MMKLNKRLTTISAFLNSNDKIIDIGCDHNLLAIYNYLKRGIIIIGSDIKKEPLVIAQNNINKYGLSNVLSLRLGNGLETVTDDIDTVVISGMGAISIIKILDDLEKHPNIKKIIVSPNNDFVLLREKLNQRHLVINEEVMVEENHKYYLVMEYLKGNEDIDCLFGKLDFHNQTVIDYYQELLKKNNNIINKIKDKNKKVELEEYNKLIINKLNN